MTTAVRERAIVSPSIADQIEACWQQYHAGFPAPNHIDIVATTEACWTQRAAQLQADPDLEDTIELPVVAPAPLPRRRTEFRLRASRRKLGPQRRLNRAERRQLRRGIIPNIDFRTINLTRRDQKYLENAKTKKAKVKVRRLQENVAFA